jgi:hypothetical protein
MWWHKTTDSQKWRLMEQFGYNIWIQQRHPSLLKGSKLLPTGIVIACEQNRWSLRRLRKTERSDVSEKLL